MKPISLKISAFGPYAGEIPEIRFDQFEEKGLFLIAGDTGAGKTTIFDAICYALYGETSGSYRDSGNLRSEYAGPGTESYVDFCFSHQGKVYHALRTPSYEKKKKNGTGTTKQNETAVFYEEGKEPVEGLRNVDAAVKELLHIDRNQFKQIVMIAQGEFREMLNAKTDQRTEILRTIFMTENYKEIEFRLKSRMDASTAEKLQTESSIVQHFCDVTAQPDSEQGAELKDMQEKAVASKSAWNIAEITDVTERIIAADAADTEKLAGIIKGLEEELKERSEKLATAELNNGFIGKAEKLRKERDELAGKKAETERLRTELARQKTAAHSLAPVYDNWESKSSDNRRAELKINENEALLKELNAAAEAGVQELKAAESKRKEAEDYKLSAGKIADDKEKYLRRDELRVSLAALEKRQQDLEKKKKEIEDKENGLKKKIGEYRQTIEELKAAPDELSAAAVTEKDISALAERLDKLTGERSDTWKTHKSLLREKQECYEDARRQYEKSLEDRLQAERIYESSRAGLLAGRLREGEKCPVCGSIHHPEPAKLSEDSISEDELNNIRDREEKKRSAKDNAFTDAERERTALEESARIVREEAAACFDDTLIREWGRSAAVSDAHNDETGADTEQSDITAILETAESFSKIVSEKKNEIKDRIDALDKNCRKLDKTRELLDKAQGEESNAIEKEKNDNNKELQNAAVSLAEKRASLDEIKNLGFENWDAAEKELRSLEAKSEKLLNAIRTAEEASHSADKAAAEKKAEIKALKEKLNEAREEEAAFKKQLDSLMDEHGFADTEELKKYMVSESVIAANENAVNKYDTDVSLNKKQLAEAEKEAEGREKVDIEGLRIEADNKENELKAERDKEAGIRMRIKTNSDKLNIIRELEPKLEKAKKDSSTLRRLYELVKGQTGNGKITLEQYVQAAGFDGIIRAANRRLLPMSDGQFELYRKEDSLGKKSNTFLDLEVLDNYTGHRRPVGNLSGGESFKASLSLALGLSDTVSSSLGGVQMDALFIDEGFGSLDRKSIESAMDILLNLSGSSKLVGIISHREELKESIPQQIRVSRTREGSRVETVSGI